MNTLAAGHPSYNYTALHTRVNKLKTQAGTKSIQSI